MRFGRRTPTGMESFSPEVSPEVSPFLRKWVRKWVFFPGSEFGGESFSPEVSPEVSPFNMPWRYQICIAKVMLHETTRNDDF